MGGSQSVKSHIENAERTGVFQLTKCNLTEFPNDIIKLNKILRTLDLSYNKLRTIPALIGNFQQLKSLSLNNNRILSIPTEISNLTKLEVLTLNNNLIKQLPQSISKLINLKRVILSNNELTSFPTVFANLKHLDFIDLSHNKITQIEDNVKHINASEINLNQNQISILSESIADCPRLKVLRLDENCLQLSSITNKILVNSQISLLAVDGNVFELKDLHRLSGYESYMERYTATKKKIF